MPKTGHRLFAVGNPAGLARLQDLSRCEMWNTLPSQWGPNAAPWPWRKDSGGLQYRQRQVQQRAQARRRRDCTRVQAARDAQYKAPKKLINAPRSAHQLWAMPACWQVPDGAAQRMVDLYGSRDYPLRYDWRRAYFTDGSVQRTEEGAQLVGAAAWRAKGGTTGEPQTWLIHPGGCGPTNTINRAEGAAVFALLVDILEEDEHATIFTDSQWVIHMLSRAVWEPASIEGNLHGQLLQGASRQIVARANNGIRTSILKVKAHTGVVGNEGADSAAKRAAHPEAQHDLRTPAHLPFDGHWGVAFRQDAGATGTAPQGPAPLQGGEAAEAPPFRMLPNTGKALASSLHATCKTGHSKLGVHATLTAEMYKGKEGDRALPHESNAFRRRCNSRVVRVILKHRLGAWWHRGKAHRWRTGYRRGEPPPPDGLCPLCRTCADSSTHALLECSRLKAMHIKRHDSTVRKILRALQRRTYGGGSYYTILDACKAAELGALGAAAKRLPRWLLPALNDDERAVLRPDILRIIGLPAAPTEAELARALTSKPVHSAGGGRGLLLRLLMAGQGASKTGTACSASRQAARGGLEGGRGTTCNCGGCQGGSVPERTAP